MKKKFLKLSLTTLVIGLLVMVLAYLFFHFVTDEGITLTWHPEVGKPFVANLIGQLGVLFLFSSAMSLIIALVFFEEQKE